MKAVLQRVKHASVAVDEKIVGEIGSGLLVLLCVENGDTSETAAYFARKVASMRIFPDEEGRMNRSMIDAGGSLLAVSQFTLAANWRKGNRPSFIGAASPEKAKPLFDEFCDLARGLGIAVETGVFGAHMDVQILNDGPVTIWMDSAK